MNLVRQPIQHRTGQPLRAADFRPVLKRKVGRDNQTLSFIGSADHLEQQFRASFAKRYIAEFIKDQQMVLFKLIQQSLQLSVFSGLQCAFVGKSYGLEEKLD